MSSVLPSGTGASSPPMKRLFSSPTNTLTCGRSARCSVRTRSSTPGHWIASAASAAPTEADRSSRTTEVFRRKADVLAVGRGPGPPEVVARAQHASPVHGARARENSLAPAALVDRHRVHRLTRKMWPVDPPLPSLRVRPDEECALLGADEDNDISLRAAFTDCHVSLRAGSGATKMWLPGPAG